MRILQIFVVCLFYCAAITQPVPSDRHPVVIVMIENHAYSSMYLSSYMPNLTSLTKQYGVAQNFDANGHYSIGNYLFQTFGKVETTNDGYNPDTQGYFTDDNIIRHLLTLGKTYKMYEENIDSAGSTELTSRDGLYVRRHNPLSYTSEFGNMTTAQRALVEVPFTQFAIDIAAHQLPDFSYVTPNLADDGHNGTDPTALQTADSWLQKNIFTPLLRDAIFQQTGTLIISVDESLDIDCLPDTKCPSLPEYTSYCTANCGRRRPRPHCFDRTQCEYRLPIQHLIHA
jgi:acid phosphatase